MKVYLHRFLTLGAFALFPILSGCSGGPESEAPAEDKTQETAAETKSTPASGSAEDMLKLGDAEIEKAANAYKQAQQAYISELSGLMQSAQEAAGEGKEPDMNSEEAQKQLETAQKKLEGVSSELQGYAKKALEHYQEAQKKDPGLADAYLGQFMAYSMLNDRDAAISAMDKGTDLLKAEVDKGKPSRENLAKLLQLYFVQGKIEDAETLLQGIQKKYPDDSELQKIATETLKEIADFKNQMPPGMPGMQPPAPAPAPSETAPAK